MNVRASVGWDEGRDPVRCHTLVDGVEVRDVQCGTSSSDHVRTDPGRRRIDFYVSDRDGLRSEMLTGYVDVPAPPSTHRAQQGGRGANTFKNPNNASGQGTKIAPNAWVDITCRQNYPDSVVTSNQAKTGGNWWYLVASSPWDNQYWAPSTTFWNGDTPQTPSDQWTDVDTSIRVC